jgi:hypothetical protein
MIQNRAGMTCILASRPSRSRPAARPHAVASSDWKQADVAIGYAARSGHAERRARRCRRLRHSGIRPRGSARKNKKEAPVGVEPTMADLQSGAEGGICRGKLRFRKRCTHGCTHGLSRPGPRGGGRGMVEPAPGGPGWHPRDGAGEPLSPGGRWAPRGLLTAKTTVAPSTRAAANSPIVFCHRRGGRNRRATP